ncbi:RagB/SusD family nutrient uptake outer membrane protein [Phocaeicola faecicola]|jgi:hypothetical protein|uniref:RagB/SusD family nutrient uptake outer membrane protein n=1 Tax=Phocaeicola faecicola TaxID=2739389 RepID=UPI002A841BDD|nr:RagB/SusD family nutrient uptake outer membrane protein [Phocaeicola faecicola]MCI5744103.1 RagB/SusD family nutrient uptake outer membrane protein [Bacteroides sp.]MDD6907812.1 RagB/SusD family nutrient uptake outer membrane protein [Bacteroidaceae bacterium]MDY4601842.1 RagB/SusD family nutrient uptake outer membrane protein [Bacteroides uniformis]MDY4871205.1 RagB/SusD family nutrient uptake outer membrane protein [Phocaeicola faecicola]
MKKYFICGALALMSLTSCSDSFLEVHPTVNISEEEYYNSEERIYSALVAAYDPLQWPDWGLGQYNPLNLVADVMSDDIYAGGSTEQDNEHWHRMHKFTATPEIVCSSLWSVFYSGINRANIVMAKMDGIPNISQENKERYLAEAHFLRAYYYTWLWKLWGNIPYYTVNPSTSPYLVEQISADEVYPKIIEDLDYALGGNRLPESVDITMKGRVTKAVAQMLKAEVVMYQNDESRYAEVLSDMRSIISSRLYSLHDDFAGMWEDEGEWCEESIWEINYHDLNAQRSWGNPIAAGGTVLPTLIGINECKDEKFAGGWGFGTVNPDLYNSYDDDDQRKDGGILNFAKYKETHPDASYTPRYEDTGYFLLKYLPRQGGNSQCTGDKDLNYRNNLRVYRYAETLLNAAELILRTGGDTAEAQNYLDQVRARAYRTTVEELGAHKVVANIDNVLEERHLELYGEGKRFWDLVRSGKANEVLGGRGYKDNKKYLPIPSSEIDKSAGTLTQNPY